MYSPSTLEFVGALARTRQACESERELLERAARARRREQRRRLPAARLGARSILHPVLLSVLIAGAFGAGHAL